VRIISLLYHDVVEGRDFTSSGFQSSDANLYKFSRQEFREHLERIEAAIGDTTVVTMAGREEVLPEKAVIFTFDDGGASALSSIADLLEGKGWRGMFFIATSYVGQPGFLDKGQIRELHQRGHVMGSHSHTHPLLMGKLSREQIREEWRVSVSGLSDALGQGVRVASVPGGYYKKKVAECASESGVDVLFNSEPSAGMSQAGGCVILGRYSIRQGVSAEQAAEIAQGRLGPRVRQWAFWNLKKPLKAAGGNAWLALRRRVIEATWK